MRPRRFFWKLFFGNVALLVIVLISCIFLIIQEFDRLRHDEIALHLRSYVTSLAAVVEDKLDVSSATELQALVDRAVKSDPLGTRITIILVDGKVLADSQADARTMESHANRAEVINALKDGFTTAYRWSSTVSRDMHYAALRIGSPESPRAVLRAGIPVASIVSRGESAKRLAIVISVMGLLMTVLLALGIAKLWSRRISAITQASLRLLRGNLETHIEDSGDDEVAMLARSLNSMRIRLAGQLTTIARQNESLKSMLTKLREGVIIVGPDGRIRMINSEAIRLLEMVTPRPDGSFEGLSYEQCIPNHDVQELLHHAARHAGKQHHTLPAANGAELISTSNHNSPTEETRIQVDGRQGEKTLLARVFNVPIPDAATHQGYERPNADFGQLLVFTDITQLTEIIQMKSDFASNASHELRTPLSALRAAVETLRTLNTPAKDPQSTRFFDMIERQLGRMEAMVLDLLDLSRVEMPGARFETQSVRLRGLLDDLRETFDAEITEKGLQWRVEISSDCERINASPQLLQIALRNLLENAIRFTSPGGFVRVTAQISNRMARIEVIDNGCGIPAEDQSRVFERFYQVERARSGTKRGTGLGLSIVRHSVSAMHGSVRLSSELGQGTTVAIELPLAKADSVSVP